MNFINHTPFPALAFYGLSSDSESFHVVVLRQTFTFAAGALKLGTGSPRSNSLTTASPLRWVRLLPSWQSQWPIAGGYKKSIAARLFNRLRAHQR
jgi:hypothetical protein